MPLIQKRIAAALLPLALAAVPAAAAPVKIMTAPAGAPVTEVYTAALPSGDVVVAQSKAALRYVARVGRHWTSPRSMHPLLSSFSMVSGMQRGDRWLLSWVGRGNRAGTRTLVFADFRGAGETPDVHRIFTGRAALDPVAVPGAHAGARAVWSEADHGRLFEGRTVPDGSWNANAVVPGVLASTGVGVARGPGAQRLVVWSSGEIGNRLEVWSSAGPDKNLPEPRTLVAMPAGRIVMQRAPVFRPDGDAAVLLLTDADPLRLRLEAVSIDGDTARPPRVIDEGHRMTVTEPPQVASLPDGRLVAVWRRVTPPRVQLVVANEVSPGGRWTAPLVISPAGERAGTPNLVVTGSGQPAVTWGAGGKVLVRALKVEARITGGTTTVISGSHTNCRRPAGTASGERTIKVAFTCEAGRNVYIASRTL